ncbi:MAG: hypothetical protein MOGMAGMI_00388 [Candidatus Omnitrophica bacterium]|nr:hypothetical protein [Candidatus Omnitrophota bacterium]
MPRFMQIINGQLRGVDSASLPTIYDESLVIVTTSPGAGELQTNGTDSNGDPIFTASSSITLPNSGSYTGQELFIYLNGQILDDGESYNFVGAGPTRTQINFVFDLYPEDIIRFRIDRDE